MVPAPVFYSAPAVVVAPLPFPVDGGSDSQALAAGVVLGHPVSGVSDPAAAGGDAGAMPGEQMLIDVPDRGRPYGGAKKRPKP